MNYAFNNFTVLAQIEKSFSVNKDKLSKGAKQLTNRDIERQSNRKIEKIVCNITLQKFFQDIK